MCLQTGFFLSKRVTTCILSVFVLLIPAISSADAAKAGLYDIKMEVVDESKAVRAAAFAKGLEEVVIRVSGDSVIASRLKLPPASRYVKLFSYQPVETPRVTDDGEILAYQITVHYNGTRIIEFLRQNGFPVWGEHRNALLVWLAVNDGSQQYVLRDSDESLLKQSVESVLKRRGVPVRWPLYDSRDKKELSITDIRGGFAERLQGASSRYSHSAVVSASLSWNGQIWQSGWTLVLNDREYRWTHKHADYEVLIAQALDQVVDVMGQVFAIRERSPAEGAEQVVIRVTGVDSLSAYRRVMRYLQVMPAVRVASVRSIDESAAEFVLQLRGSKTDLLTLLKADSVLLSVKDQNEKVASSGTAVRANDSPNNSQGSTQTSERARPVLLFILQKGAE